MVRCYTFWLVLCSIFITLAPIAKAAETPVSAEFFLQSIEPDPNMTMLYDFLDIYDKEFAACKETNTYLRALAYLAANGDHALVRDKVHALERCPELSEATQQNIRKLLAQAGETVEEKPAAEQAAAEQAATEQAVATQDVATLANTLANPQANTLAQIPAEQIPVVQVPVESTPEAEKSKQPSKENPLLASTALGETPLLASAALEENAAIENTKDKARPKPAESTVKNKPSENKNQISHQQKAVQPLKSTASSVVFAAPAIRTPLQQERIPVLRKTQPKSAPKQENTQTAESGPTGQSGKPSQPSQPGQAGQSGKPGQAGESGESGQSGPQDIDIYTELTSQGVYRTGNEGTSRLFRFENTALLAADNWRFSGTAVYLNAGKASDSDFTGSYYRGQPEHSLLTEQTAFVPRAAYVSKDIEAVIGTTPLGGEVSPLPTFRLSYTALGKLRLSGFQESVTDSLLSYVGFEDVFTGKSMGRVVKAGAKIGWDDTFAESWFYGAGITGAHLYGENVKANNALKGEMYIGKSFGSFALGSYSSIDHFATNLNNYTYGHGGYYSPYIAAASVLFASWEYKGDAGQIKADVSSGYLYEKTKNSDLYYLTSGPEGEYEGKTNEHITLNTGLEGSLDLSENLTFGGAMRFIESGTFNETRGSLTLKWEF